MLIYADTNIYGRPFDDQSQERIKLEAQASLSVFEAVRSNLFKLIGSDILKFEIEGTENFKKIRMKSLFQLCSKIIREDDTILKTAITIQRRCRIDPRDALHLASAINGRAKYFLTCDDDVIREEKNIKKLFKITIINPTLFILFEKI